MFSPKMILIKLIYSIMNKKSLFRWKRKNIRIRSELGEKLMNEKIDKSNINIYF